MLVIRLRRIGKKSHPTYRVVVAEHSASVQGNFVADLGFYNPHSKQVSLRKDEVSDWMGKGAKPSNTIAKLLEKEKIKHKSVVVTKFKKSPKKKLETDTAATKPAAAEQAAEGAETPEISEEGSETVGPAPEPGEIRDQKAEEASDSTENAEEAAANPA